MNFEELFKQTVAKWLKDKLADSLEWYDRVDVIRVEDDISGFHEGCSCGPVYDVSVDIKYSVNEGKQRLYVYDGDFSSFIKELGTV